MRTGDCATTTGLYQSDCTCRQQVQIRRGADAPPCPRCRRTVAWVFQRSTYMQAPPDAVPPRGEPPRK